MKEVPLSKGFVALVDDEDYAAISAFKWHVDRDGYAIRCARDDNKPSGWTSVYMHRQIMGLVPGDGIECDHRDRNRWNNQRLNLRTATRYQNNRNSSKPRRIPTLKGAHWHKSNKKWGSNIGYHGKLKHLGYYESEQEAHEVYCLWADMLHGEFADYGIKEAA
ncbi:HNH endonuclease [Burkholderia lata]|uniref:HNH endonuclease n=1 Tax=Burkholderia lata (strain ATCC 17760 / DSM 23089 / LMG 22485 / NCIMB 9086 / R18194 / 383) TaxID=482957 RepID=UPI001583CF7D